MLILFKCVGRITTDRNIRQQQNEVLEYLTRDGRVLFCSVCLQASVDLGLEIIMMFVMY